jgi:hypothetical protein
VANTAEILLTKDEVLLLDKAIEFIVRTSHNSVVRMWFDGFELNRLEDIRYDLKKQLHG